MYGVRVWGASIKKYQENEKALLVSNQSFQSGDKEAE